jgi:hypothetical protein
VPQQALNGGAWLCNMNASTKYVIEDDVFDSCSAENNGGAVYLLNTPVTFTRCKFTNNFAEQYGNDVFVYGDIVYSSELFSSSCSMSDAPLIIIGETNKVDKSDDLPVCVHFADAWVDNASGNDSLCFFLIMLLKY